MASPGTAPISVTLDLPGGARSGTTEALLAAMLGVSAAASDLIFSPGRPPQILIHGQLISVQIPRLAALTADHTRQIASDLIGNNKQAITALREQGACDVSFSLQGKARFRVNVFIQRGSCAIVMRVIPTTIPDLAALKLPESLAGVADLKSGIVLVTGPVVSGKSSTLAGLVDLINQRHSYHIITVEDPIEFLHNHIRSTIHQREVHSDAPSAGLALRAALRQSPNVIVLGEMRDRENVELLLEAAETGHLVLTSINTVDAAKTVERVVGMFSPAEHVAIRNRLAKAFRCFISQKLIHRTDGSGLVPIVEIVKANAHTRECVANGSHEGHGLAEYARLDAGDGMQDFDGEIEKLLRAGVIDVDAALAHASNPAQLRRVLEKS